MTLISATSTQAVVNHHLQAFFVGDLDDVVSDYAPYAVFIEQNGVRRGVDSIRPLFEALIGEFAKPGARFDLRQQTFEGDVAYIWWVAETQDNIYELGTDTFIVQNGKIVTQTFAFKATRRA
jgi:ketosteroid isomerase-like protein